ncbi:MAG: hypothetical protein U0271_29040 [Polyangiaceae bacterium]
MSRRGARTARLVAAIGAATLVACGSSAPSPPEVEPTHEPRFDCSVPLPPSCAVHVDPSASRVRFATLPSRASTGASSATKPTEPAEAGQPTEAAARAKRLLERAEWQDAAIAALEVARGETGDDLGNRQIAEFELMIALYQQSNLPAAEDLAVLISSDANHLKHQEVLLWAVRLASICPSQRIIDAFADRDEGSSVRESVQNSSPRRLARLLVGRRLLERGEQERGEAALRSLFDGGVFEREARACLESSATAAAHD